MERKPKLIAVGSGLVPERRLLRRSVALREHDDPRGLAWAAFRFGRYTVLLRLAMVDGVVQIASYEVRGFEDDGDVVPITKVVRDLPLNTMRRIAAEQLELPEGSWYGVSAPEPVPMRPGRPREVDYHEVARVYGEAVERGRRDPVIAVMESLGVEPRDRAAKLVARVRKAGVIPLTTRGKATAVPKHIVVATAKETDEALPIRPVKSKPRSKPRRKR